MKAILKGKAKLVFLADDCDNKDYKALITGLFRKNFVQLRPFPSKKELGLVLGRVHRLRPDQIRKPQPRSGSFACTSNQRPNKSLHIHLIVNGRERYGRF